MSSKISVIETSADSDKSRKLSGAQRKSNLSKKNFWYEFRHIDPNLSILCGSFAQSSYRYGFLSRNKQSPSTNIVAVVYTKTKPVEEWICSDLDEILNIGDKLYRATISKIRPRNISDLKPYCVLPHFYINDWKMTVSVGQEVFSGTMRTKNGEINSSLILDGLQNIFTENDAAILNFNGKYFTVWQEDQVIYHFSPYDTDADGKPVKIYMGKSCVLRFVNPDRFLEYLKNTYPIENYEIYPLKIIRTIDENFKSMSEEDKSEKLVAEFFQEKPQTTREEPATTPQKISIILSPEYLKINDNFASLTCNSFISDPAKIIYANLAALVTQRNVRSLFWTQETLSDIIKLSERIFEENIGTSPSLVQNLNDLKTLELKFAEEIFNIDCEKIIFGEIQPENPDTLDLHKGLEYFFKSFDSGLIQGPQTVAIWQESGWFFMFDPKERDTHGRKWTKLLSLETGSTKNSGSACLTTYRSLELLSKSYVNNIPMKHKSDSYRILQISLFKKPQKSEDWYNWKGIDLDQWIVMGSSLICDWLQEGTLASDLGKCVAISALLFLTVIPESEWSQDMIDKVLETGNNLYRESMEAFSKPKEQEQVRNLDLRDIKRNAKINDQNVIFSFKDCSVSGSIFETGENGVSKLNEGLTEFFDKHNYGLFNLENTSLAIWKNDEFFYLMNPHETKISNANFKDEIIRMSSALRFQKLSQLYQTILANIKFEGFNQFCISGIYTSLASTTGRPPLQNYSEFTDFGAILRSINDFHEGHQNFGNRADKQTLCNLLISLGLAQISQAARWNQEDLIDILRIGDKMYFETSKKFADCEGRKSKFTFEDISNGFNVGANNFEFRTEKHQGVFFKPEELQNVEQNPLENPESAKNITSNSSDVITVNYEDDEEVILKTPVMENTDEKKIEEIKDLVKLLADWEKEEKIGAILSSDIFDVSIWKQEGLYFIFDPKASDLNGKLTERRIFIAEKAISESKSLKESKITNETELGDQNLPENNQIELKPTEVSEISKNSDQDYKKLPNEGSAYVAWFITLQALIEHLLLKVSEEHKNQPVTLHKVFLTNKWNNQENMENNLLENFQVVNPEGHWVLRGSMAQNDFIFTNKGNQDICNCFVSLALAKLSPSQKFTPTILDVILKYGDRLYTKTMEKVRRETSEFFYSNYKLNLEQIETAFSICKRKFQLDIEDGKTILLNNFDRLDSPTEDFENFLEDLQTIESNIGEILNLNGYYITMWQTNDGAIYIFDPHETNPHGQRSLNGGVASISRFTNKNLVFQHVLNLMDGPTNAKFCEFYRVRVVNEQNSINEEENQFTEDVLDWSEFPAFEIQKNLNILKSQDFCEDVSIPFYCVAALIVSEMQFVGYWTQHTFEKITAIAKNLLGNSITSTTLEQMIKNFTIDNKVCHLETDFLIRGPITIHGAAHKISFKQALDIFFKSNNYAVLSTNNMSCAIWKEKGSYFLFYPDINDLSMFVVASPSQQEVIDWIESRADFSNSENWYELRKFHPYIVKKSLACKNFKIKSEKIPCLIEEDKNRRRKCKSYCLKSQYILLDEGVELLRGTVYKKSPQEFPNYQNIGLQYAACIIAATMAAVIHINNWSKSTIDTIMESGYDLYINSVAVRQNEHLKICDFEQNLSLWNRQIKAVVLQPFKEHADQENLLTVLRFIFEKYPVAYISLSSFCVLIVNSKCNFCLFDPANNDCYGRRSENGSPCVLKFQSLLNVIQHLKQNIVDVGVECVDVGTIIVNINNK